MGIKVSPTMTLTPWVAMHRDGEGKSLTYAALHANVKMGIFGVSATGVSVGRDTFVDTDKDKVQDYIDGCLRLGVFGEKFHQSGQIEAHGQPDDALGR